LPTPGRLPAEERNGRLVLAVGGAPESLPPAT
jgi:hypothetical protein